MLVLSAHVSKKHFKEKKSECQTCFIQDVDLGPNVSLLKRFINFNQTLQEGQTLLNTGQVKKKGGIIRKILNVLWPLLT